MLENNSRQQSLQRQANANCPTSYIKLWKNFYEFTWAVKILKLIIAQYVKLLA
jgi:hypothetical protein